MVGIFDSGIGGVTILKELLHCLPNENYYYYSDSVYNPYGEKTEEEIWNYVDDITQELLQKGCKAIVVACNTAGTVCVSKLRKKISFYSNYCNIPSN